MPDNIGITRDQLSTLFWGAELGGNASLANHFSHAEKGLSTYSFGMPQFDVGNDNHAQKFLKENGFSDHDIRELSKRGGLSPAELNDLDTKLQAVPQAKIDQFTKQHLDRLIGNVDAVIDLVRKQNPAAADAISKDPKLQLSIADYENQFGSVGPQLVGFLAGKPEKLPGGTVQSGNPPTRSDLLNFVHNTKYGQDPHNAKVVESRNERFDEAMGMLKLGPVTKAVSSHLSGKTDHALQQGNHGQAVHDLQTSLAGLGYLDTKGIDSDFGIRTRHAVERFQHDHHLTVDGKAGPLTQQAMHMALQQHATTPALNNPQNPDHALFEQALAGVRTLDAHGRATEQQQLNLSAALVVEAKHQGLTRIDQVAVGDNGNRTYIAQHPTSPTEKAKFGSVDTANALQTPMTQSSATAASIPTPTQTPPSFPQPNQRSQAHTLAI